VIRRLAGYIAVCYSITNSTDPHEDNDLSASPTNTSRLTRILDLVKQMTLASLQGRDTFAFLPTANTPFTLRRFCFPALVARNSSY
jgi:hypothetical protein